MRIQGRWNERPESDFFSFEVYQASGETIAHPWIQLKSNEFYRVGREAFSASVHELLHFHQTKKNQQCLNTSILFILTNVLPFLFLLSSSPSRFLRQGIYVCVNLCLLNIIEISAGGLIKKQLPLVPMGDAWWRGTLLIGRTVWNSSPCDTLKHTNCTIVYRIKDGLKQLLISEVGDSWEGRIGSLGSDGLLPPQLMASVCLFIKLSGQMIHPWNQINLLWWACEHARVHFLFLLISCSPLLWNIKGS